MASSAAWATHLLPNAQRCLQALDPLRQGSCTPGSPLEHDHLPPAVCHLLLRLQHLATAAHGQTVGGCRLLIPCVL